MDKADFQIIFDKMEELTKDNNSRGEWAIVSEAGREELDEIAELSRLSGELNEQEVACYTTT